jgi:acetylornithine deacetylase/succinyl-diaminopimelate desuccinylase-like protein
MRTLPCVFIAVLLSVPAQAAEVLKQQVDAYRRAHERAIVGQLATLVAMKSIAADPAGVAAAASYLEGQLRARGFDTAQLKDAPGTAPLIYGSRKAPGAHRTVVFYAHYDGQPVTPSQWRSDPFEPVMRSTLLSTRASDPDPRVDWQADRAPLNPEWRLYGRAAADDKASVVAFLAAIDALAASHHTPSVNIKVVWDGEEESGSPHIEAILRANQARLQSDLWLIGDGPVHQSRRAQLYFGARGSVGLEVTVYGPLRALHDGHYGNWVPNPAVMAAELIAQMRDSDGRILIPGFGDDVRPVPPQAAAAIAQLPPVEDALQQEFGIGRTEGSEPLAASIARPALNIRGIRSGQVGAEAANAIPVEAAVSIDFRLVPDQTPAGVRAKVEQFLAAKGWTIVGEPPDAAARRAHPRLIRLVWEAGYPALRTDMTLPAAQATIAAAQRAAGGPVALLPIMGGSVPIYIFADIFHAPVIGLPIVNHDDNQHAANENLRLQNLWDGIDVYAAMLGDLRW